MTSPGKLRILRFERKGGARPRLVASSVRIGEYDPGNGAPATQRVLGGRKDTTISGARFTWETEPDRLANVRDRANDFPISAGREREGHSPDGGRCHAV
jgi:hypothetical protein